MRRLAVAVALSIAAHEILAGLIPGAPPQPRAPREVVTRAQLVRVSIHSTRRPYFKTPTERRPAPLLRTVVAAQSAGGAHRAPAHVAVSHRASIARLRSSRPVWDLAGHPSAVAFAGAQSGGGAGAAAAGGTQGSATGSGTAAAAGIEPCGFVEFSDPHGSHYDSHSGGFYVDIRMSVHFADGTSQSLVLDYPWYYASEAQNPWSVQNAHDPNFPTRFQPPPQSQLENEPALVRYVIDHSTSDGMTLLKDCPSRAGGR